MKNFLQDVRYGLRILTKHSGFTAAAVLTLALGIGANTAIFSLVDGVLLKPLPFEDPDRLLTVWEMNTEDGGLMSVAPPNFQDWRDQNTVFEDVVAFYRDDFTLTGDGAEQIEGAHVSAGTFRMLGVAPALGRELLPEEDQTGGPPAVVLSHPSLATPLWRIDGNYGDRCPRGGPCWLSALLVGAESAEESLVQPTGFPVFQIGFPRDAGPRIEQVVGCEVQAGCHCDFGEALPLILPRCVLA